MSKTLRHIFSSALKTKKNFRVLKMTLTETQAEKQHLFNYCDEPAYDMNHLVLDCYKALGKPKTKLFHFPYALAYFGGLCFDLLAIILHKKFAINSIRVKKFCQNTWFKSSRVPQTEFSAPVILKKAYAAQLTTSLSVRWKGILLAVSKSLKDSA